MSRTNTARISGDEYQARVFWLNAANLLNPKSPIVSVAWETGPKGMDDIRVDYDPPKRSANGPIVRDYIQCKWHVGAGEFGFRCLIDPAFVNGVRYSWLERAYSAFNSEASTENRFILQTNWRIGTSDPLFKLKRSEHNELNVAKLFSTKTDNSEMGAVRKCWREHLKISDSQLRDFVGTLIVSDNTLSMEELRDRLDDRLGLVKLRVVPTSKSGYLYDDLVNKLHREGNVNLNEASLIEICNREELWDRAVSEDPQYTLGIRSFMHKFDDMENRCDALLDLVPYFEGRFLKPDTSWQSNIAPSLASFVKKHVAGHESIRVRLDAHGSIAVAVGRILDVKCGLSIEVEQRTIGKGLQFWSARADSDGPELVIETSGENSPNTIIALSVTHDVIAEVVKYCDGAFKDGYKLIDARLEGGPSGTGITGDGHAWKIAETLAAQVRKIRTTSDQQFHFFAAAPNGLMFFIGRQLGIGKMTIYEYDFDWQRGGGYQRGITL